MLKVSKVISAETLIQPQDGLARHQFVFTGTTGSVALKMDSGVGLQPIATIDLTDVTRKPYVIECEAFVFEVTPSVSVTMAYSATSVR